MRPGLQAYGFEIVPAVLDQAEITRLIDSLSNLQAAPGVRSRDGVYAIRNLLRLSPAVRDLTESAAIRSLAEQGLGGEAFPVRATLFDKTAAANWLVPWHQDLTISVADRLDVPGYGPWTRKAGVWYVRPPAAVLDRMLAVRIHLDDCGESNGALRVFPGSHCSGRLHAGKSRNSSGGPLP